MRKQGEHAQTIAIEKLVPFRAHPFVVRDDDQMRLLTESISSMGILTPAIARPLEDGTYELIAGHRRKHACELLGLLSMPVIVRDISDDTAIVMMVDSNLQREVILPSEKAKAYKMKLDALKRQGARTDLTSDQVGQKLDRKTSREQIADIHDPSLVLDQTVRHGVPAVQRQNRSAIDLHIESPCYTLTRYFSNSFTGW